MVICSYNEHRSAPFSRAFGWFAPPKSTRSLEPTLLWNQLHSLPLGGEGRSRAVGGEVEDMRELAIKLAIKTWLFMDLFGCQMLRKS